MAEPPAPETAIQVRSNFSPTAYEEQVQKVISYILDGDIFEANISQCFSASLPANLTPFDLYRRLRQINPAPFAAYLHFADMVLASASPERFIQLTAGRVETRPIKGTRPRGKSAEEDARLARELVDSEKDWAENVMIVDLLRNDLSRVCEAHSVQVPQLCGLESYPTVHHLVSVVTGTLREGHQALDLLKATFPGGSITGAPKVRAMEIIAELEPTRRGPYCGSVIYLGFDGNLDSSIIIRSFSIKNKKIRFQAGGAIVADSIPREEQEEVLAKARALFRALGCEHDPAY
jgi:para-aminobenzoate synthetase component 1